LEGPGPIPSRMTNASVQQDLRRREGGRKYTNPSTSKPQLNFKSAGASEESP
jgi:hypothetical protein